MEVDQWEEHKELHNQMEISKAMELSKITVL